MKVHVHYTFLSVSMAMTTPSKQAALVGFSGGSDGKESAYNVGDLGSIPGLGRSPGGGHGNPLQYSCLQSPHGQRSLPGSQWVGYDWACAHTQRFTCTSLWTQGLHTYAVCKIVSCWVSCCCCSVAKSCLTLWDFMNCCTPGFPVLHYLPELGYLTCPDNHTCILTGENILEVKWSAHNTYRRVNEFLWKMTVWRSRIKMLTSLQAIPQSCLS